MPEEVIEPVVEETTPPVTEEVTPSKPKEPELTQEQQRAFDKRLGKELAKLRREHDERLLEAIKSLKPETKEAPAAKEDSEPKEEDFADFKEFTRALARWEIRQERKAEEKRQQESKAKEEQAADTEDRNQIIAEHNQRIEDARDKYDDFDEVVTAGSKNVRMTQWVHDAIMESEDGPELMYYLAQNPEEASKLADMRPATALRQLERIAAKVSEPTREAGEEKEEAEPAPVIKPTTQPIRPVRKAAPTVTGLSDDLSWAEWTKRRNAQIAKK